MWESLFTMLKAAFDFGRALVQKQSKNEPEVDAQAQREGTEAGAAANRASKDVHHEQ